MSYDFQTTVLFLVCPHQWRIAVINAYTLHARLCVKSELIKRYLITKKEKPGFVGGGLTGLNSNFF